MNMKLVTTAQPPAQDWPELVSLDSPKLPRINISNIPSWAGQYAKELSASTETPIELAAGMVLVSCAVAAARRLKVMVKPGYFEPCNLWMIVALPPGNRKSAVQAASTAPLLQWEQYETGGMAVEIKKATSERSALEARIKELQKKAARENDVQKAREYIEEANDLEFDLPQVPIPPQLWTSDATPERLGMLLADHEECMGWLSSEGGIFDMLQGRYSNNIPNLDLILKAHNGDAERVDRSGRSSVLLHNPRLSIGLCPQPDVLSGLASKPGFRGRGLLARFLYLSPASNLGFRHLQTESISETTKENYIAGLQAMLNWETSQNGVGNDATHTIELSEDAYNLWFEFSQSIEYRMRPGGDMEHFTDWAGKAPGGAVRIAGVLHSIKYAHDRPWEVKITAKTMFAAVEIMSIVSLHSLAVMNMMGADPTISAANRLWIWVERNRLEKFTAREAFNSLRSSFPRMKDIWNALEALEERGYVYIQESVANGVGRPPSPTIRVRPELISEK